MTRPPLVLDMDGSVLPLPDEIRPTLPPEWSETLRFGCGAKRFRRASAALTALVPPYQAHGPVLMGSGDFHHLSWPLILRCLDRAEAPVQVVVLDNHPDSMVFPWGVHCGSWIGRMAMDPRVSEVHVVGVTSEDLGGAHAWEHDLRAVKGGKATYWSTGVDVDWAHRRGLGERFRSFDDTGALTAALSRYLGDDPAPTYLSIDKDVFAPDVVRTNWDQGQMTAAQGLDIVAALKGALVGADITGEVSLHRYRTWWKRWLSRMDGQTEEPSAEVVARWQSENHPFNLQLVQALQAAWRA
ncbi:MAG: hypothetical protein P0Y50_11745 [Candidatus Brevundimonas colombiensis]|uniref:Arginase family protein n=1 Tax=Candidatus Brevundimonas colombiensis TaxID=3121376 RepID=A0AAJ5WXR4_9CAUL|nr:arginase family protein [Brevundimonas sp.]WEK39211.1 MAG: hypothetical protein P0Y50_11745 [Brevundimonas sp.]